MIRRKRQSWFGFDPFIRYWGIISISRLINVNAKNGFAFGTNPYIIGIHCWGWDGDDFNAALCNAHIITIFNTYKIPSGLLCYNPWVFCTIYCNKAYSCFLVRPAPFIGHVGGVQIAFINGDGQGSSCAHLGIVFTLRSQRYLRNSLDQQVEFSFYRTVFTVNGIGAFYPVLSGEGGVLI